MQNLIINDVDYGECKGYFQDKEKRIWNFDMDGFLISINFDKIKRFTSHNNLEILVSKSINTSC